MEGKSNLVSSLYAFSSIIICRFLWVYMPVVCVLMPMKYVLQSYRVQMLLMRDNL